MVSLQAAAEPGTRFDARPVPIISTHTVWDEAVALRDRLAVAVEATLQRENFEAIVLKSQTGNFPAWIRLEAWIPDVAGGMPVRRRCELELIVDTRPFNKYQLVCSARLTRGKRTISVSERTDFSERDAAEWTRYAIERGSKPSNYHPRLDAFLGLIGTFVPPLAPRYNPLARDFREPLFGPRTLVGFVVVAMVIAGMAYQPMLSAVALGIGGLVLGGALLLPLLIGRSRHTDWVVPQPREAPRHLGHVDSWHAVLSGLGAEADGLKALIIQKLSTNAASGFAVRTESYGHRTPNGYEERDRIVVSHGQGQVHIHFHRIGDDLFVGWQAHLNWARWAETDPVTTKSKWRHSIAFRNITPGWYHPNEFDLFDLDSLSSVVHSLLEREIKHLLRERSVDQEVDFEVNRGDRGNALDARSSWPERTNQRARNSNMIFGSTAVRRASPGEMQLAPVDSKASKRRNAFAHIPAVILLPALTALGFWWLYQAQAASLFMVDLPLTPNFRFRFFPLFHLPLAAAVALGLWLYANVRAIHALLTVAVIEALAFSTSYLYQLGLASFIAQRDLADPTIWLAVNTVALAVFAICHLLAVAIWVPTLVGGNRWLVGLVLWTLWAAASLFALREFRLGGMTGVTLGWSTRLLIAATVGYWLWRDYGGGGLASLLQTTRSAARPAAARQPALRRAGVRLESVDANVLRRVGLALLFIATAVVALRALSWTPGGGAVDLGPAVMPSVWAVLLLLFGAAMAVQGFVIARKVRVAPPLVPLLVVIAAAAAFALSLFLWASEVAATCLTTAIIALYALRDRLPQAVGVVVVSIFVLLVLATLLQVPLPFWLRL
jgi:hypothetical protein